MTKKSSKKQGMNIKKKDVVQFIKRALIVYAVLLVIFTILITADLSETETTQYPEPTENFFIEDYSGVFSEATEQFIMTEAANLFHATKAQIVVVAVPNTQADELEKYSYEIANRWGIGDADRDNGVLILFTTEEPHVRLEIGRGLEGCLPDGKCGRILDDWAVDAKDNGRWNEAALNTWIEVAQVVYEEYGLEAPDTLQTVDQTEENITEITMADASFPAAIVEVNTDPLWQQILVGFIVSFILSFVLYVVICIVVFFMKYMPGGSSGTGGSYSSWGGGSSGGGGFSGGGGSFGGGGASR